MQQGQAWKSEAQSGLRDSAQLQQQRDMRNKQLVEAKKQQEMSSMGTGATTGAMIGAEYGSAGGPWGVVIGAGVGLIAGWALS